MLGTAVGQVNEGGGIVERHGKTATPLVVASIPEQMSRD
jgi:hypothetical protein